MKQNKNQQASIRKEVYKVKCPKHIVIGDPLYFEDYSGEKLKSLVVDHKPSDSFEARLVLEETPNEKYPEFIEHIMTLYLAPKLTIKTYMDGYKYESQNIGQKLIGVDTACYIFCVDQKSENVRTGADGYWGEYQEFYRDMAGGRVVDAVIIRMYMPDFEDYEQMKQRAERLFDKIEPLEKKHGKKQELPDR